MLLRYKGIVFDDYNTDENGNMWSQICTECAKKFKGIENELDDFGSGICGVRGCTNGDESSEMEIRYIDFDLEHVNLFEDNNQIEEGKL